jgi:hypothetical protein
MPLSAEKYKLKITMSRSQKSQNSQYLQAPETEQNIYILIKVK